MLTNQDAFSKHLVHERNAIQTMTVLTLLHASTAIALAHVLLYFVAPMRIANLTTMQHGVDVMLVIKKMNWESAFLVSIAFDLSLIQI